jgi:hypothetical protein
MAEQLTPHAANYRRVLADASFRTKQSEKDKHVTKLDVMLRSRGLHSGMQAEYRFHPKRMWRFDRAWPAVKVAVEFHGGTFGRVVECDKCSDGPGFPHKVHRYLKDGRRVPVREGGRHNTGAGLKADAEKFNAAQADGWRVFVATAEDLKTWDFVNLISRFVPAGPTDKEKPVEEPAPKKQAIELDLFKEHVA